MHKFNSILLLLLFLLFFQCMESRAQYIVREGSGEGEIRRKTIVLPYAFSSETLGFGIGLGGTYNPESQPQSTYFGTVYGTSNGSWLTLLGGNKLQISRLQRLYISPYVILSRRTEMRLYVDGNPNYTDERAGSNESSEDNYITEDAYDSSLNLGMQYILPWGHYRDSAVHTYITHTGLLAGNPSGAQSWNPLESGKSTILFKPYYRRIFTDYAEKETLYFELGYEHDNRDYVPNPHRGYKWDLQVAHDPDWLSSTHKWTTIDGEIDGYIPLPSTSHIRQQTLALSGWTAYSPTYDVEAGSGKPPFFTDPALGGLWRLRGYSSNRFHDKAAVCYTAEYRIMPEWQPFGAIDLLDPLMIRWWQVVGLVELGRVAPTWNFETLHSDMKYDFGIGLRGMFHSGIGRLDIVASDEGVSVVAMFGQTF